MNPRSVHRALRRGALSLLLLSSALGACARTSSRVAGDAEAPPNIVFILVDDLGERDIGPYGSTFYETPNLDRLAREGLRFTRAYAAAPICSPTRASALTGLYPARLHMTDWIPGRVDRADQLLLQVQDLNHLPRERVTVAEALRERGYATASIGKWHLGGAGYLPTDHGFDINIAGSEAGAPSNYLWPYRSPFLRELSATGREGEELTERQGEEAAKFIAANRSRPFFLYLPLYAVHTPIQARPELVAKYQAKARATGIADAPALGVESGRPHRLIQSHPTYAGLVETMDVAVGRVMRALEENGVAGRTLVIFSSDNGGLATNQGTPTTNLPLRAGKGWLYEGGIRVPLIVRWPGRVPAGRDYAGPVISNDFFPTILDAAGIARSGAMDGVSLLPALTGGAITRGPLFWHYPHYSDQGGPPSGAIRDGDLKLIEFFENRRVELYDLRADPGETRDLARSMSGRADELRRALEEWRLAVGAQMPAGPNPRFDPDSVPAPFVP